MKEYILSNAEAKMVDEYTISQLGIPGKQLMKTAGNFVTLKAKLFLKHLPGSRIDVFCGTGNNGGDGFVAAAELQDMGAFVNVWIVGDKEKIQGDALYFFKECEKEYVAVDTINKKEDLKKLEKLHETDLIIDALLGTGFRGQVEGILADVIGLINEIEHPVQHPVLAVDIPSGIDGDTGKVGGIAIKAMKTVTMGFLKRGLLYNDGPKYAGQIFLADLKYPDESFSVLDSPTYYYHKYDLVHVFPDIPYNAYKNLMGKVLVIAGSKGMTGAAYLASMAAQKSGAGLVINAIPESLNSIMEMKLTEVMTWPVPESKEQTFCPESMALLEEKINWADVIVFGPGVSGTESVMEFGRKLLTKTNKPIIIDADGLKIFVDNLELMKSHPNLIITPHMGEFGRLLKKEPDEIRVDRITFAKEFVKEYKCQLLLKGAHSISINKDMTTAINSTGNPALATAGSGDILSGIIAGFIAQGIDKFEAVTAAMAVHGYAADLATREFGIRGLTATDLLKYIPMVLREFDKVGV
ncbi:MAG: NAD(P)H-hydrate dehydratase [Candidatus Marinimicrobia bacterium]|nr:NAD(P)H-hydrate dehydratase [Candidatus Neomarinimicrobiota bacterium]